ncbi:MAG: glycosyltransferase [Chitinophagales bacterium]|nr:glycosyltransferase [Chitinophagales bacterium]
MSIGKEKKHNVLYMSYDGMTDPLGQSQVLPYLKGLSGSGYRFTLISCEKPDRLASGKNIIQKICDDSNIEWHPLKYTKKPPILSTVSDLRKMKSLAIRLNKEKKFSLIHCRGYITSIAGLSMKKKYGVPFLFDMRGFWADEKVDAGAWRLSNPAYRMVYKYFKKKERAFLSKSDKVISLTHKGAEEMLKWDVKDLTSEKISVIPCSADTDLFDPERFSAEMKDSLKKELKITKEDIVISYLGSIGTWYMLDEMLIFFKEAGKRIENAKMLFITYDEHERIRNAAKEKGIDPERIIIRPGRRDEVPALVSLSDISVFFIRPTYSKISSSPTKQGEIMAMGIPVICNDRVGDVEDIVNSTGSGYVVHGFRNSDFEKAVERIPFLLKSDRSAIRSKAKELYSLDVNIPKYVKCYKELLPE